MNNESVSVKKNLAWVVAVSMGYGHQRTAFPLRHLAGGNVINANDYLGIPDRDKKTWNGIRQSYETISNFYRTPLIGKPIFHLYDRLQRITRFYPKEKLMTPTFLLRQSMRMIRAGWGKHLIEKLKSDKPFVSTFFTPAFMAESFNYPGDIFCVICDADVSRSWAPLDPQKSRIKYFAPTERVVERLKLYGVKKDNIIFSGFPLPLENIGEKDMILKDDLRYRILNLDPNGKYIQQYSSLIDNNLGQLPVGSDHPLTIMFSIGGAGAQKELAVTIVQGLVEKLRLGEIKIILSVGIKKGVKEYLEREINNRFPGLSSLDNLEILCKENIQDYFAEFDSALRKTDILWTKPSEVSFYSALGIPIIISPTIGSQEEFNERWLLKSGFGFLQENPKFTHQWLFDSLDKGYLAEAAMEGFIEGERLGVSKIKQALIK